MSCFKAYDIRGLLGEELNELVAERIGYAFASYLNAKRIVLGADVRPTSRGLLKALARGIHHYGASVIDLGMVGTEEVYYAAQVLDVDGGIEVTASHNPIEYNGMKCVKRDGVAMGYDTGLSDVEALVASLSLPTLLEAPMIALDHHQAYIDHLLTYLSPRACWEPMRIVVNAGHGAAGHVIDAIEDRFKQMQLPITFIKLHHQPDGSFPAGIPNPMIPENRGVTQQAIIEHGADWGIAWDGDFDRCFLFDQQGQMIEAYYVVALLARAMLVKHPNAVIVYDPRLIWNTEQAIKEHHGQGVVARSGHSFIKAAMRQARAVFGGESSAHYYFKTFGYCDSGMIPWLLVLDLLQTQQVALHTLVAQDKQLYPCSGERNYQVIDQHKALLALEDVFAPDAIALDRTDGTSFLFEQWRFNVRSSNTEPLLRLNVETKADHELLMQVIEQIEGVLMPLIRSVDEPFNV